MTQQLAQILIVDDDPALRGLLTRYLGEQGFAVVGVNDGIAMDRYLGEHTTDLIILDLMLPGEDGLSIAKRVRSAHDTPILMLSARGEDIDRIVGLEVGADDYLAKPFEPRELVARIHSVLRRSPGIDNTRPQTFGSLEIDFAKHLVKLDGEIVDLTTNEFVALSYLVKNAGKVLDRDQILQELRGMDCDAFNRSVDITMSRLRQKLKDDPKTPSFIKTVWGTGYVFIGDDDA